jgi:sugar transferase (PEP-CTERM system associated)
LLRIFRHHIPKILVLTIAGDLVVVVGSAAFAYGWVEWLGEGPIWPKIAALAATTMLLLYLADLYNVHVRLGGGELVLRLGLAAAIAAVLTAALGYAMPPLRFGRTAFFMITGLATLGLLAFRLTTSRFGSYERLQKRVLVLGTRLAGVITSYEGQHSALPFKILGFLDDDATAHDNLPPGYDLLGKAKELLGVAEKLRPDILLVALTNMRGAFPVDEILECRFRGVRVEEWPTFYERLTGKIFINRLRPSWLIFAEGTVKTRLTETIKRAFDVALSFMGLILSAPFMGLAAICIKLDSPGPVLFRQERVGKDGQVFVLYKFRSMRVDAERITGPVWASEYDPRVTRVGGVLRKIRFDEVPQMFNVLIGNMSFIGPRPERLIFVTQLKEQIPFYVLRFSVKPGITGWAQVKYQYGSTVEDAMEKLQYDLYYVKNMSVFLDLLILLNSLQVVLLSRGAR